MISNDGPPRTDSLGAQILHTPFLFVPAGKSDILAAHVALAVVVLNLRPIAVIHTCYGDAVVFMQFTHHSPVHIRCCAHINRLARYDIGISIHCPCYKQEQQRYYEAEKTSHQLKMVWRVLDVLLYSIKIFLIFVHALFSKHLAVSLPPTA